MWIIKWGGKSVFFICLLWISLSRLLINICFVRVVFCWIVVRGGLIKLVIVMLLKLIMWILLGIFIFVFFRVWIVLIVIRLLVVNKELKWILLVINDWVVW